MNAMALRFRIAGAALVALVPALVATSTPAFARPGLNRSLDSVHQPVVDRTDFTLDLSTSPKGLAPGEAQRLSGWFDGLDIGYGDTVTLDDPAGWHGAAVQDGVGAIVARYGMLVSHEAAPVTVGHPAPGMVRVVVSRAVAHVDGCPNWAPDVGSDYGGGVTSNFGCATAVNLAAMVADPQDLVRGRSGNRSGDARVSVKAIQTYRDADPTGKNGLPGGITSMSVVKGN
jgi:pilus assembly protein CpaD